jgi:CheY-like chemotaxis protein
MMGYVVLGTYCDGKDIVDKIDSLAVKPEVIIMDERMPRMTGLKACSIIVRKYPEIKIIFVTGDGEIKQQAMKVGAVGLLLKPVSIRKLADMLGSM